MPGRWLFLYIRFHHPNAAVHLLGCHIEHRQLLLYPLAALVDHIAHIVYADGQKWQGRKAIQCERRVDIQHHIDRQDDRTREVEAVQKHRPEVVAHLGYILRNARHKVAGVVALVK